MLVTVKWVGKKPKKGGSGEYDATILVDEKGHESTFGIFQDKQLYVEGAVLDITVEKKGNFWNIVSVKSAKKEPAVKVDVTKPVPVESFRTDRKGNGQNRSFALSYAKDYHCARIRAGVIKDIPESKIIATAILFESYLDKGG